VEVKRKLIVGVIVAIVVVALLLNYVKFPNTLSGRIVITSDADFEEQGWSGSGSQLDPYVISGRTIYPSDTGPCIDISNTSVYFIIQDCYLESAFGEPAIRLEQVVNALVKGNTIVSIHRGIELSEVSASTFSENTLTSGDGYARGVGWEGISGFEGGWNVFARNLFVNINQVALRLMVMDHIFILNNTFTNTNGGISLS